MKTGNKIILTSFFLLSTVGTYAEETAMNQGSSFPEWASNPANYIIGFLFFILAITIYVLYKVNITLLKIIAPPVVAIDPEKKTSLKDKKQSWARKTYLKMLDSVPVEKEKDVLLDHDYDGIKELDNNLPPWWKYGFYFTIFFAVCYMIYYSTGTGKLPEDEYRKELALAAQQKEERIRTNAEYVNEINVVQLTDAENISKGKETFSKYCVACHRSDGGGQVGPNLTDEYWLHGGGIKHVFSTITDGVPSKGMISWKSQLSPKQIQEVASFVISLSGTNPQDGKEPQGDKWIAEVTATPDSTASASLASTEEVNKK